MTEVSGRRADQLGDFVRVLESAQSILMQARESRTEFPHSFDDRVLPEPVGRE